MVFGYVWCVGVVTLDLFLKTFGICFVLWGQVYELDKEIQDYKEKIELYRAKLQEIVSSRW